MPRCWRRQHSEQRLAAAKVHHPHRVQRVLIANHTGISSTTAAHPSAPPPRLLLSLSTFSPCTEPHPRVEAVACLSVLLLAQMLLLVRLSSIVNVPRSRGFSLHHCAIAQPACCYRHLRRRSVHQYRTHAALCRQARSSIPCKKLCCRTPRAFPHRLSSSLMQVANDRACGAVRDCNLVRHFDLFPEQGVFVEDDEPASVQLLCGGRRRSIYV